MQSLLVQGSRQPGRGGFYPDINIGERLPVGRPDLAEHSHLIIDRLGHPLHSNLRHSASLLEETASRITRQS